MSIRYDPSISSSINSTRAKMLTRIDAEDPDKKSLIGTEDSHSENPGEIDQINILDPNQSDMSEGVGYSPDFSNFSSPNVKSDRDDTDLDKKNPEDDPLLKVEEDGDEDQKNLIDLEHQENYVPSAIIDYYNEAALSTKARNKLPDSEFGIPRLRAYPLNDEKHVRLAIQMFSHCKDPEDRKSLAKKIFAKVEEYGMDVKISKDSALYDYAPKALQETTLVPEEEDEESIPVYGFETSMEKRTKEDILREHLARNSLFYNNLFFGKDYKKSVAGLEAFSFLDYFYPSFKTHNLFTRLKSALGGLALDQAIYKKLKIRFPLNTDFTKSLGWAEPNQEDFDLDVTVNYQPESNWFQADLSQDFNHIFYCLRLYSIMGEMILDPDFKFETLSPMHVGILTDWAQRVIYHYDLLCREEEYSEGYYKEAQYLHDLFWCPLDDPMNPDDCAGAMVSMIEHMVSADHLLLNMNETTTKTPTIKLYHLSSRDLDGNILYPKIPDNYFTKNGYEDAIAKRVCFGPSIDKCLMAMSQNCTGLELFVYVPDGKYKTHKPSAKEVPDSVITGEVWITEPVKLKCIGKIAVTGDDGKPGHSFKYGEQTAELYGWKWKWIEHKTDALTEGTELISKEDCAGYLVHELGLDDDMFLLPASLEYPIINRGSVRLAMDMIRRIPKDQVKEYAKNLNRKYRELGCTFSISVDHPYAQYADQNIVDHMNRVLMEGDTAVQDDGTTAAPTDRSTQGQPWYRRVDMQGSIGQNMLDDKNLGANDKNLLTVIDTRADSIA